MSALDPSSQPPEGDSGEAGGDLGEQERQLMDRYWEKLRSGSAPRPHEWLDAHGCSSPQVLDQIEVMDLAQRSKERRERVGNQPASAINLRLSSKRSEVIEPSLRPTMQLAGGELWVLGWLGAGGMGELYRAWHNTMNREVVVKLAQGPATRARFRREIELQARLGGHLNIALARTAGQHEGRDYLVLDYVSGFNLQQWVKANGPMPWDEACRVVRDAAEGLSHAHSHQIVHRDIKPSNLVRLARRGTIKIIDWGLARCLETDSSDGDADLTESGCRLGTWGYMSPEQINSPSTVGPASDLYSLGCTFYYLLAGNSLFGDSLERPRRAPILPESIDVPPDVNHVVRKLLSYEPAERYQTAKEVIEAIDAILGVPREARLASVTTPRPPRWQSGWLVGLTAVALLTLVGALKAPLWAPSLYRIAMNQGELIIHCDYADVRVLITQGGNHVRIVDPWTERTIDLHAGRYEVALGGGPNGLRLSTGTFTLTRGGKRILEVSRIPSRSNPASAASQIDGSMVWVPPGRFLMGAPDTDNDARADEKPQHPVRITKPLLLMQHEVTVREFREFVEQTGYRTEVERNGQGGEGWEEQTRTFVRNPRYTWRFTGFDHSEEHPVVNVTWHDAAAFCNWLSRCADLEPYYPDDVLRGNAPVASLSGLGYRLPTEAEWEYACRAGTKTRFLSGDDPSQLARFANLADGSATKSLPDWLKATSQEDGHVFSAPVMSFRPNEWGLFDMVGNVSEWIDDWSDTNYYRESPLNDPSGRYEYYGKVVRGASWIKDLVEARSSSRGGIMPNAVYCNLGFRVCRALPEACVLEQLAFSFIRNGTRDTHLVVTAGRPTAKRPAAPLGPDDVFVIEGRFERPTFWYVVWVDPTGAVEVIEASANSRTNLRFPLEPDSGAYPDPKDPPGTHLVLLIAGAIPSAEAKSRLEDLLRGLPKPPAIQPEEPWHCTLVGSSESQEIATATRGGKAKPLAPGHRLPSDYLADIRQRLRGAAVQPVHAFFLSTKRYRQSPDSTNAAQ